MYQQWLLKQPEVKFTADKVATIDIIILYDCEFVTPPPDAFQTECPVCLQIPKEPCGKEFCRECIERIKHDNKPCPMCNKSEFTFLQHYGSERYLNAQEVFCSRKNDDGCEWKGKLKEYEQHLNAKSVPRKPTGWLSVCGG